MASVFLSKRKGALLLSLAPASPQELAGAAGNAASDPEAAEAMREILAGLGFTDYLKASFGGMDILLVALAVFTGWGVPQKLANR